MGSGGLRGLVKKKGKVPPWPLEGPAPGSNQGSTSCREVMRWRETLVQRKSPGVVEGGPLASGGTLGLISPNRIVAMFTAEFWSAFSHSDVVAFGRLWFL